MCDFSFVRIQVMGAYGTNGNVGLDPEIVVKLMFLLFWDNVKSERELMRRLPERLDYLWFLGYGPDDAIPNHSVLSKARHRWGGEVFESIFIRSVSLCLEQGLVGGKRLHMDGCLIDADAAKGSVVKSDPEMIEHLRAAYAIQEGKLEGAPVERIGKSIAEGDPKGDPPCQAAGQRPKLGQGGKPAANQTLLSRTDPDNACVRKKTGDESRPRYRAHRAGDVEHGVIVATETTAGDVGENQMPRPSGTQARCRAALWATRNMAPRRISGTRRRWACGPTCTRAAGGPAHSTGRNASSTTRRSTPTPARPE